MSRIRSRRSRRAGFTLLELMAALVAGLIAITAIYAVSSGSSRHFHEQQRLAQTQMSLRMAMDQLRRDISNAGLFGTPNSAREQTCVSPPFPVRAVEFGDDEGTANLPLADQNLVTADSLRLTGSFGAPDAYMAIGLADGGSRIVLQKEWQGFRRDFGDRNDSTWNEAAFASVFRPGRVLHYTTLQGNHFFSRITGVSTTDPPGVLISPAFPIGGHCMGGLGDGGSVSILSRIEYSVIDPNDDAAFSQLVIADNATLDEQRGLAPSVLVRREIDFGTGAPIVGSERVVLEFVANFDLEFLVDTQTNPGEPALLQRQGGATAEATLAANPERVRAIFVDMSARTAGQEPNFPWVAREDGDPLTRYRATEAIPGAARVRTMRAEIVLPNLYSRIIR